MIKINKPKFWDEKRISFYSILLLPLTLITNFIIILRKIFAKSEVKFRNYEKNYPRKQIFMPLRRISKFGDF